MARRQSDLDPRRDDEMAQAEHALWNELAAIHINFCSNNTDKVVVRNAYEKVILDRIAVLQQLAACGTRKTNLLMPVVADHRLHTLRRQLAILHQELELLTLDDAQARAVGEDGAFIAVGRSYVGFLGHIYT